MAGAAFIPTPGHCPLPNRMAEPEEWSNKLPSTSTLSGVVKRVLWHGCCGRYCCGKPRKGEKSAFSTASPALTEEGSGSSTVITISAEFFFTAVFTVAVPPGSSVGPLMKPDFFTGKKHLKPHRLPMHVFALQGMSVHYFHHAQAGGMNIDGIIHHTFIQTTDRTDQSLTAGEMSRIGLCREITWIVLATQADREFIPT